MDFNTEPKRELLVFKKKEVIVVIVLLALFGAALLYGDGVITPAISVLSAVEF
jgi:KUP system potassium uptake protein